MPTDSSAESDPQGQQEAAVETDRAPRAKGGGVTWRRVVNDGFLIGLSVFLLVLFIVHGAWPNLFPKNFGVVEEGRVYRSGELTTAALESVVKKHGIRTVIDFGAHDNHPKDELREQKAAELMGVERHVLYLHGDGWGNPNRYAEALRIMTDESRGPVLVHCAAGAQRTGCAVALYRTLVEGWDDERALQEAQEYLHDPEDNPRMPKMYHLWKDEIEGALRTGESIEFNPPPGYVLAGPRSLREKAAREAEVAETEAKAGTEAGAGEDGASGADAGEGSDG